MIINGDSYTELMKMEPQSVDCIVTSPPYWGLRDYGVDGQLGLEKTPEEFVDKLVQIFSAAKSVLNDRGTLWLNLGDSYAANGKNRTQDQATAKSKLNGGVATQKQSLKQQSKIVAGLKQKDLVGIPWRVAFALQKDGWYLRQDIIWHKPNPMPESVTDRCTKAHEYIFLFSKAKKYHFDNEAILEPFKEKRSGKTKSRGSTPLTAMKNDQSNSGGYTRTREGRNKRSVWTVTTKPFKGAHFATFPPDLIEPCILAGCPKDGIVLDPFFGAGTTGVVAKKLGRKFIGIDINKEYCEIASKRIEATA